VPNTGAYQWLESQLRDCALRSGKSHTNRNASSNRDAHHNGNFNCFTYAYGNRYSNACAENYSHSTASPFASTAPVISLYENKTHYPIRIL
jgi:hypothetical protein